MLVMLVVILLALTSCASNQPKLRVVMGLSESEWQVMREKIFPPFEKEHGVKIEAVQIEANDLPQVLLAQVAAGKVNIDVFAQDNMQLSHLINNDLVEDLSVYENELPKEIIPNLIQAGKFDNKLYFMPYRPNVQITYYNKAKFDQYGLKPPRNWNELFYVARVLKQKEGVGKVLFKAYGGAPTATQLYEWIVSAGGDPLYLNDAGTRRTFLFLRQLWPYLAPDSIRAKFDTSNEYMARDSAYLMQNWPFGVNVLIKDYDKKDIATYHGFSGPKREAHVIGGEVLGIPKGAQNIELSLKFIQYLQSKPVQEQLVTELGWPSIRRDAYGQVPAWMKPHFKAVEEALEYGIFRENVPYWDDVVKCLNGAFEEIVLQGAPSHRILYIYHNQLEDAKNREP